MTAIKTPYAEDGHVDLDAFDRHVEHQIANGVDALIIGGTTGEGHLLSWEEHLVLIAHAKTMFKGRILIVGNTGSNSTEEMVNATKKGFAVGMDCSLLINPYYGKTSAKGIVMHLEAAMKFGPAIIYNVPGRTGQDITPDIMTQISGDHHFVGVKECMGFDRIKLLSDMGMAVWSGNDDECHRTRYEAGARGVISVTSNIVPNLFKKMMTERNDEINEKLGPLYKWLFAEPNPIGVNTMLMMLGMCKPVFRMPYTPRELDKREEGVQILKAIGLEHCPAGTAKGLQVLSAGDFSFKLSGE
jgi:4-hydroxy-tetrahydrodipicolinate synthase